MGSLIIRKSVFIICIAQRERYRVGQKTHEMYLDPKYKISGKM